MEFYRVQNKLAMIWRLEQFIWNMIILYELIRYYKREINELKFTGYLCSSLIGVHMEDSIVLNTILLPDKKTQTNRPGGYKTFSCSTQLSMKFQLLIKN